MEAGLKSGDRLITAAELEEQACRLASGFEQQGIGQGDAIALLLRNDVAFFQASLAAAMLGAYAVPINWHFKAQEIDYILRDCGAKLLVAHRDLLNALNSDFPEGLAVLPVDCPPEIRNSYGIPVEDAPEDGFHWQEWVMSNPVWSEEPRPNLGSVLYTSGTTGNPKGVMREPQEGVAQERMLAMVKACWAFSPGDAIRTVITGPVYHSAPNFYALSAVRAGGFVMLQPRFDAEELLAYIDSYKISHLHMVPTMFSRLLALPHDVRSKYDLSSLVCVAHGAAPCSAEMKKAMIDWWGPVFHEYYGGTETGGITCATSEDSLKKPGSVGRPIPGADIAILDENKKPVPTGETGEIYMWIKDFPNFTYKNKPEKRAEVEANGLVTLGDVGYLDEEGYLYLCDRVRDMVISGGVNIYPAEIEGVLHQMPEIKDCAVFGIPDSQYGESLCTHIEFEAGRTLTRGDVISFLQERLANYKVPRTIEFVDSLPREDTGKIFKRKIRDTYWQNEKRAI